MTLPVYPGQDLLKGLKYSSKWDSRFYVQSATTAAGADEDILIAQYPLHDFELDYQFLRDGPKWGGVLPGLEFRTMKGFFLAMSGSAGRFLFRNPDDHQVWQNQIGIGDGATTTFTITRTFGANGFFATEPVGQVDTAAGVNVYLGGSATPVKPTLYAISTANPCANTITFTTAPTSGQAIAIDMRYFYYCKLAANSNSFDKFMDRIWAATIKLHSCRAGA